MFKRGSDWVLFEKSEDGCIELFRNKSKEVVREYERAYGKTDESYDWYLEEVGLDVGRSGGNNNLHQFSRDSVGNGSQTESEEFQADTEGNKGHLLSGDGGISDVTVPKSSLRHSPGIADSSPEQSLVAQNEVFRPKDIQE